MRALVISDTHGTAAQRALYRRAQWLGQLAGILSAPRHVLGALRGLGEGPAQSKARYRTARATERRRRARVQGPEGTSALSYSLARQVRPSDPSEHALRAFDQVVHALGWNRRATQIVFAHTHQPLADVTVPGGTVRYWPGTAVLIDTDAPAPQLLQIREHLNPLAQAAARSR